MRVSARVHRLVVAHLSTTRVRRQSRKQKSEQQKERALDVVNVVDSASPHLRRARTQSKGEKCARCSRNGLPMVAELARARIRSAAVVVARWRAHHWRAA